MTDINSDIGGEPRRRGRPPKNGTRDPSRDGTRERVILGRDGEVLSRKQTSVSDPFDVPHNLKDRDWDYQWNSVSVVNNTEVVVHQDSMMQANGWRPVPADRPGFKERFGMAGPKNPTNCIIIGGQRLDERPMWLTEEAKEQEYQSATGQIRNRDEAMLGGKAALKDTLDRQQLGVTKGAYKGRKSQVQIDIDPEAPRPSYQYGTED